jgi:predicted amidohydrolase YtcJ
VQEQIDLLVSGGTVVTQNPARDIIAGGAVAMRDSRIAAVGLDLDARCEARRRIDATGRYVFPGLINPHTPTLVHGVAPRRAPSP